MKVDQTNEQANESISAFRIAKKKSEANQEIRNIGNEHIRSKTSLSSRQNIEVDNLQNAYEVKLKSLKNTYEDQLSNIQQDYEAAKIQARVRHEEHMQAMRENFTEEVDRFQQSIKDHRSSRLDQLQQFRKEQVEKGLVENREKNNSSESLKKDESKSEKSSS